MASILKVDELQGIATAGDITVTSEGGAATQSLQQGLAKAWANVNQVSFAVSDSFNIASATDDGTGQISHNLTNAMSNALYAIGSTGGFVDGTANDWTPNVGIYRGNGMATGKYITQTTTALASTTGGYDVHHVQTTVSGDLA